MSRKRYTKSKDGDIARIILGFVVLSGVLGYTGNTQFLIGLLGCTTVFLFISWYIKSTSIKLRRKKYLDSGIAVVDKMAGEEFEKFLEAHFVGQNYKVKFTPKSNDYGADLILEKDGIRTVIQAKRWNEKVGIKAIQEIVGAVNHYNAQKAIVVTNNYFTSQAETLALSNSVELWNRDKLIMLMRANGSKETAESVIYKTVEDMNCPKCNSSLVQRTGKHGQFYGCSSYPKCNFTRN